MQGFEQPNAAGANQLLQTVPQVPSPNMPGGVTPNLTQYPAAPFTGYPPPGFPQPPQGATYQPYFRVPGPQTLGPAPGGPAAPGGTGGVAGVAMAPITAVAPPPGPGGPHPLLPLPQAPLPQGFPNPFSLQQVAQAPPQEAPPQQPGVTTVTGPMGQMPGLGYFPPPPNSFPTLPGFAAPQPQQQAPAPQAPPTAQPQPPAGPNPFWLQLAWQLVQTPPVKQVLGDSFQVLLESEDRMRALQICAGCLTAGDMQAAFKALTAGQLEQARFTEMFAQSVRHALASAGLL
ncbi:MAG TPA: hypothetical protein VNT75_20460 [Symbiobacteriaceae bacterium]|nr:hypothetical protein [Symbiobacteriaceae bacterium]